MRFAYICYLYLYPKYGALKSFAYMRFLHISVLHISVPDCTVASAQLWAYLTKKTFLFSSFCNSSCNMADCGFDAGDCGTTSFHLIHRIDSSYDPSVPNWEVKLPAGARFFLTRSALITLSETVCYRCYLLCLHQSAVVLAHKDRHKFEILLSLLWEPSFTHVQGSLSHGWR
jgi:hypothetical protein